MKPEIDEIISQGIKKPSCSDLLVDENNSMVELEKPSTWREILRFRKNVPTIPVKVSIPRFLEHGKQPESGIESGIEEIAFFDYDPQGRTKLYHVDDLQSKPTLFLTDWCWAMYRRDVSKMTHNLYIGLIVILKSSTSVILVYCSVWQEMFAIEFYRSFHSHSWCHYSKLAKVCLFFSLYNLIPN